VGKKTGIAFAVVGVLLVLLAIVWWTVIGPQLAKLPDDINTEMKFEGTLTLYFNPETGQPLPAGRELTVPITVDRMITALPDLYTSGVAVLSDASVMTQAGAVKPPMVFQYALDRVSRKCVTSDQNWAYTPQLLMPERVGNYGLLFPGGLGVGDKVSFFFNDPGVPFDVTVASENDNWHDLGVTGLEVDGTREWTPYNADVANLVLIQGQGLPTQISFATLKAQLDAIGFDLDTVIGALAQVATAEEMASLTAMTQQPVNLVYSQESSDIFYIEKTTGATIGATFNRTTGMSPDATNLAAAVMLITKYAADPNVGPTLQAALAAAAPLADAEPTPVYNQTMSITAANEAELVASAEDKIPLIKLATFTIPLIVILVGAVVLLLGVLLVVLKGRKPAAASTK
jgi:hypothetical protein